MTRMTKMTKKSSFTMNLPILSILILVLALAMVFSACQNTENRPEQEGLIISGNDLNFIIHEDLVNKMNEEGYDSLTVYSQKIKT